MPAHLLHISGLKKSFVVPDATQHLIVDVPDFTLEAKLHHRPRQLSTGQQQRVAVARALANKPKLVLADEPTGNLDHKNARESLALIRETCRENGAALLLVSHDREVLAQFEHVGDFHKMNRALALEGAR